MARYSSLPPVSRLLYLSALGLCPKCGMGKIFEGFSKVKATCSKCKLPLDNENSGDGPAAFLLLIIGFPAIFLVGYLAVVKNWNYTSLLLLFAVLTFLGIGIFLRPLKAFFVILQYYTKSD